MRGGNALEIRLCGIHVGTLLGTALLVAASGCDDTMIAVATFGRDASTNAPSDDAQSDDSGVDVCFGCNPPSTTPSCPPGSTLGCYVNTNCPNGEHTTIAGTVFDPAGKNPLANVAVYVPENPIYVAPLVNGTSSCTSCSSSVSDWVAVAITDAQGNFTLRDVPTGNNIPLVIQVGKWRRTISVPRTSDCKTTQLPSSGTNQARLPRNRQEGNLPQMALLTGGCDNFACFLSDVGVDATEFSAPGGGGRVEVYQGLGGAALSNGVAGDCTTAACPLWSSKKALEAYDEVFLGCECGEHDETKPPASLQAMHDWLDEGGRVFAVHSQTTWFKNGPADFQSIANWTNGPASGAAGPFVVDTTTAQGASFGKWLASVGAADANGVVTLDPADVSTSVTTVAPVSIPWINDSEAAADGGSPEAGNVKAFSARVPIDADSGSAVPVSCGAIHVTDIHPGGGQALQAANADGGSVPAAAPAACVAGPLSAGEKALEYLLFNQPICIGTQVMPPPPRPGTD